MLASMRQYLGGIKNKKDKKFALKALTSRMDESRPKFIDQFSYATHYAGHDIHIRVCD